MMHKYFIITASGFTFATSANNIQQCKDKYHKTDWISNYGEAVFVAATDTSDFWSLRGIQTIDLFTQRELEDMGI